jgi:CBS domain-containing protein
MNVQNLTLKARDLMQTRIVAATRQYSVRDLAVLMHSGSFSGVPIIDPGNHLVGMVTEFDILRALAEKKDLHDLKAETIMSPIPFAVEEQTTAEEVIHLMITHKIIRVPVVRDGRLLGIISRTDILDHMVDAHLINIYGT